MSKPNVTQLGESMRFEWPDEIVVELDRFYDGRGDISAEATIYSQIAPNPGLLHHARLNLMSTQARATLAKQLESRVKVVDWPAMLEQLCYIAVDRYRCGEDPIDLCDVDPYAQPKWLRYPYVEYGGPTILYADGMVGKSIIALWIATEVALGVRDSQGKVQDHHNVLYLDWETSREVHAERLIALCAGMGIDQLARPSIKYRRMTASLSQSADAVRKWIAKGNIGLVVVDSLGMAGDGPPEEAATALGLARAINSLNVPTLCIHHKRKAAYGVKSENERERLFGSVYYANFARLVWEMERAQDEASGTTDVALVNVKRNNGPLLKRHALHIEFVNVDDRMQSVKVAKAELTDVPAFASRVPLRDRIMAELRECTMATAAELAENLDVDKNQIQVRLSEMRTRGTVLKLPDSRWGLVAHE